MAANSGSAPGDVFDVRKVRRFIELMNEHDLAEIDLRQGDQRIRLRRGPETITVATTPHVPLLVAGSASASLASGAAAGAANSAEAPADAAHVVLIKSPMVGAFYAALNPESAP